MSSMRMPMAVTNGNPAAIPKPFLSKSWRVNQGASSERASARASSKTVLTRPGECRCPTADDEHLLNVRLDDPGDLPGVAPHLERDAVIANL
jgi:hypothetical protein